MKWTVKTKPFSPGCISVDRDGNVTIETRTGRLTKNDKIGALSLQRNVLEQKTRKLEKELQQKDEIIQKFKKRAFPLVASGKLKLMVTDTKLIVKVIDAYSSQSLDDFNSEINKIIEDKNVVDYKVTRLTSSKFAVSVLYKYQHEFKSESKNG